MTRREYKTGTKWCLWRWKDIMLDGALYLRRLHIFQCPWFAVNVHWIYMSDPWRHLHDHPCSFLAIILRGGYTEVRKGPRGGTQFFIFIKRRWFNMIRAQDRHRIAYIHQDKPAITLCIVGPRRQEWGFFVDGAKIPWKEYQGG